MRQLFSLSNTLVAGDWMKLRLSYNDSEFDAVVVRYGETVASILSNETILNGCDLGHDAVCDIPELNVFSYSWEISYIPASPCTVEAILGLASDASDLEVVGIYLQDGRCKMLDGTTSSRVKTDTDFRKSLYETTKIYTGMHGYHAHHGESFNQPVKAGTKPYRIGVELEVEFKNETEKNKFCKGKSNWFFLEHDGSLGDNGVEIITVPIRPMDAKSLKFWEDLVNYLSPRADSWNTSTCGLHVHIGREILGKNAEEKSETIGKLLYLYHHHLNNTPLNSKVFGRDRAYHERDGKTAVGNAAKLLGSEVLKDKAVKDRVKKAMTEQSSDDRYYDINLTNSATIEFRKGRGSINTSRICLVVEYCEKMVLFAKSSHWENISYDNFVAYMKKNVKLTSPLRRYFEEF